MARARWTSNLLSALFAKTRHKLYYNTIKVKEILCWMLTKIFLLMFQGIFILPKFIQGFTNFPVSNANSNAIIQLFAYFTFFLKKNNNIYLTSTHSRDRFKESTSCSAIASSNFPCCWYSSPRTLQQLAISLNSPLDFALAFTFNSSKERKKVTLLLPMPLYEFSYLEHL